jgi:flavin reductase (DIM6/NTAB) family NADH-FMN oxidoreductase RutF
MRKGDREGCPSYVQPCTVAGHHADKFLTCSLTPEPSKSLKAPCIKECIGHIECTVADIYEKQGIPLFIGKIERAFVEEGYFRDAHLDPGKARLVHYLGGSVL